MPHRVLGIICTSPGWGGLELNTLRLAQWLGELGWKVHLLTAGGTPIQGHAAGAVTSVQAMRELGAPGKSGQLRALHPWVRRHKIRVLLLPFRKDVAVASLYKRFYDGDMALIYQQHMQVGVRKRDLIHTLRYAMLDVWISPLQYLKEETLRLTRVPENKIEVIPFGIEPEPFLDTTLTKAMARQTLGLPDNAFILGTLGRLDPKKGQDLVVRALSKLPNDTHVLLMGNATLNEGDTYTRQLHQLVQNNGWESRVHLRPYNEQVMLFYRAVDIFAMPSHGETFGMVTIEAMAAGVPVVGTDKDGTREILGEGRFGWLFPKEDLDTFCNKVTEVRDGHGTAEKIKAAREAALSIYSKEKMLRSVNELLLELVEEPTADA